MMRSSKNTQFAKKMDECDIYNALITRNTPELREQFLRGNIIGAEGAELISKVREMALAKFIEEFSLENEIPSPQSRFYWNIFKSVNNAYNAGIISACASEKKDAENTIICR